MQRDITLDVYLESNRYPSTIVGKQWYGAYMDSVKYISIMKDYKIIQSRS